MNLITDWVTTNKQVPADLRLFNIVALGGMGRSALTWKWFNDLDERTANRVAHALRLPESAARSFIGKHQLRLPEATASFASGAANLFKKEHPAEAVSILDSQSLGATLLIGLPAMDGDRFLIRISRCTIVAGTSVWLILSSQHFRATSSNLSLASARSERRPAFSRTSLSRRSANLQSFVLTDRRNCLPSFLSSA